MILRPFLLGSAVALSASALLVIPEAEADAIAPQDDFPGLLPLDALATREEKISLGCTECPFRESDDDGNIIWTEGSETSLALTFSVEDGFLLANGRQIFPPPPPALITAVQHRLSDGEVSDPIPLGYAVEMMPLPTPPDEPMDMIAVRFTVLDLDGHPVPLDTVALNILHDSTGNLYLAKAVIEETTPNRGSWGQCHGRPQCLRKLLFDRIRALFASAKGRMLGGMRPKPHCGGRPHGHEDSAFPHPHDGPESAWADGEDRPPRPHHHHHGHHHHSGWERTVSRVVRFIVVPAVLGVMAGLAASALGMLVGQIVVFLWQRRRRSSPKESEERGTVAEKESLMTESSDELPPSYYDEESLPEVVPADKN